MIAEPSKNRKETLSMSCYSSGVMAAKSRRQFGRKRKTTVLHCNKFKGDPHEKSVKPSEASNLKS